MGEKTYPVASYIDGFEHCNASCGEKVTVEFFWGGKEAWVKLGIVWRRMPRRFDSFV